MEQNKQNLLSRIASGARNLTLIVSGVIGSATLGGCPNPDIYKGDILPEIDLIKPYQDKEEPISHREDNFVVLNPGWKIIKTTEKGYFVSQNTNNETIYQFLKPDLLERFGAPNLREAK